jgi:hypothetical protein
MILVIVMIVAIVTIGIAGSTGDNRDDGNNNTHRYKQTWMIMPRMLYHNENQSHDITMIISLLHDTY